MKLTDDQEMVLKSIFRLAKGDPASPVTISAIHGTFADMDVRDLVRHLGVLIDCGLIKNARPTAERIGNVYVITQDGIIRCKRNSENGP